MTRGKALTWGILTRGEISMAILFLLWEFYKQKLNNELPPLLLALGLHQYPVYLSNSSCITKLGTPALR